MKCEGFREMDFNGYYNNLSFRKLLGLLYMHVASMDQEQEGMYEQKQQQKQQQKLEQEQEQ